MRPEPVLIFSIYWLVPLVSAQTFVPEYCDWPDYTHSGCTRMQFSPSSPGNPAFRIQWQLWSALDSLPKNTEPFASANYFRYVTTNGAMDIGLTARTQTELMTTSGLATLLCFRFYYFVSSVSSQLAIYLVEVDSVTSTHTTTLVWQLPTNGIVTGQWVRIFKDAVLTSSANQFYFQMEATSRGLQPADTAIAQLSITFGQCFDIIEEDIIPSSANRLEQWPYATTSITIFYDTAATYSTYQSSINSIFLSGITNVIQSAFESTSCSLSAMHQNNPATTFPSITIIGEPSQNAMVCAAMVGPFASVTTEIHLTESCLTAPSSGTILIHLLAHALGLKHEHRRTDRLNYLILNKNAYDPIFQPFFDPDSSMDITDLPYDEASATQVSLKFLDQTGGRSPYGTLTSIGDYAFGSATSFSQNDLLALAKLLGGDSSICSVRRRYRCSTLCYNGGVCSRRPKTDSATGTCLCKAGFTGTTCTDVSCFPPCQNGFCDPGNVCNCASVSNIWTGSRCHIPVASTGCISLTCTNGGTCISSNGMESCICHPGYSGPTCSSIVCEQCQPTCPDNTMCASPNRLNCSADRSGSFCEQCAPGYIGNVLTGCKPYCTTNCSGHGVCISPDKCLCHVGWTGSLCNTCSPGYEYLCHATTNLPRTCYPPCSPDGGYCSVYGYCSCYAGFEGITCDRQSLTSTTTPAHVTTTTSVTTPFIPTTTELIRCPPKRLVGVDASQLYIRYLLSPFEVNFRLLITQGDAVSFERQSLEDFLNRALREELNRFTDRRFMRLIVVNVCPGVVVDVLASYFTSLNITTASRIVLQQARAIGVPLTDGKTALSRLDFDYIPRSQLSAVSVQLCTVYDDLGACENGGMCTPADNATTLESARATLSPLMTPSDTTWPSCKCPEGYSGEFCSEAQLPLPVWGIVTICVGGILLIALATVAVHLVCGSGRQRNRRQHRYHRSHPLPPPPGPMPGYLMVPYMHNRPGTLPHPGGAPYNIPVPFSAQPQTAQIPNEPPPPYHHVQLPSHCPATTIQRSQIRAEDVDDEFTLTGQQCHELPPPPGYAPPPSLPFSHQPLFTNSAPIRQPTGEPRNRTAMIKRPKLGR